MSVYPEHPGYRVAGPSQEAAEQIATTAKNLRSDVFRVILRHPDGITADDIAAKLDRSVLSVRPRVSELRRLGMIEHTGARGRNDSGMSASVWRVAKPLPNEGGGE